MDSHTHGLSSLFLLFLLLISHTLPASALPDKVSHPSKLHSSSSSSVVGGGSGQINSNSVLVALLDSHYTELAELVEKALLLPTLEDAVSTHNLTIFAPSNQALYRDLHPPDFKRFLLQPSNLFSLQTLLLFHVIPSRISSHHWPLPSNHLRRHLTLSHHHHHHTLIQKDSGEIFVDLTAVVRPDDVVRPDGIIHGIERLLIPRSVQDQFNRRRSLSSISAVKPEAAPTADSRTKSLKNSKSTEKNHPAGSPPVLPIYDAMAPCPDLSPAPAPGPGGGHHHFDGESHVKDFIKTLIHYGGYNEMADMLVNLTSLASEIGKLVSEGYVLTILAPNDEAMAKLTTDQLSNPESPEKIIYYHLIPEYQTEESMYNTVRRFRKIKYNTLLLPYHLMAGEGDGSVRFGNGDSNSAYLFDPDIYTDGRISVQGIDGVLFPEEEKPSTKVNHVKKKVVKHRRGKLLEIACTMLGTFGQDSHFASCQ